MQTGKIFLTALFWIGLAVFVEAGQDQAIATHQDLTIYVKGEVNKPGGFTLAGRTVSVLQSIEMAGGLGKHAEVTQAVISRPLSGKDKGWYRIIPVNLKDILLQKESDIPMQPGDTLFVPSVYRQKKTPTQPRDIIGVPEDYAANYGQIRGAHLRGTD